MKSSINLNKLKLTLITEASREVRKTRVGKSLIRIMKMRMVSRDSKKYSWSTIWKKSYKVKNKGHRHHQVHQAMIYSMVSLPRLL